MELLSNYDPVTREHLTKVKASQDEGKRLQAHYLSYDSQNEFIEVCGNRVVQAILEERRKAKYFSLLVDGTPDSSHSEQLTFVLRYVLDCENEFKIKERFLAFVNQNNKTGREIADTIIEVLKAHNISIDDCRGQGFDNGANMAGIYKGVQALIKEMNPLAFYTNCGNHSLNLCGVNAAECCAEAITFFGMVQKVYNFFSKSPQRWEILTSTIGCSLHGLSDTRWSSRVEAVEPFCSHLHLLRKAIEKCRGLNLTAECKTELNGIWKYLSGFECIMMGTVWLKILKPIEIRNKVLQARSATLDVEVANIDSLISELKELREKWDHLLMEAKRVANALNTDFSTELKFPEKRQKKRKVFHDENKIENSSKVLIDSSESLEEIDFKVNTFYVIIDAVIVGLRERFQRVNILTELFRCLWDYLEMEDDAIAKACSGLVKTYPSDINGNLTDEVQFLKSIHRSNLDKNKLKPLVLLNKLKTLKLDTLFPNICIALRLFCTLPVTVAEAERSFSKLSIIKNCLRSTMGQQRTSSLSTLSIEWELARELNFQDVINDFAAKKARRVKL